MHEVRFGAGEDLQLLRDGRGERDSARWYPGRQRRIRRRKRPGCSRPGAVLQEIGNVTEGQRAREGYDSESLCEALSGWPSPPGPSMPQPGYGGRQIEAIGIGLAVLMARQAYEAHGLRSAPLRYSRLVVHKPGIV